MEQEDSDNIPQISNNLYLSNMYVSFEWERVRASFSLPWGVGSEIQVW